ncbi:MAG: hypothetical protein A2Y75_03110 [Candidatus Solincola sediminis]|uniref:AB hydrolase-1 domain-containing protein n=1 Tax=Candidatus Solincola sediminis TaxID=1797199 RepID=A0A1F2WH01_9ACTN|nr:MAG: hypothetical protein A2Y75_03110 [Candidatus Solincola sediminis]
MPAERINFYSESLLPIRLEGILDLPEGDPPYPGCILCHPHPIGGGSMDVPLLAIVARALSAAGWACLRFNFRGVGRSSGESTGGINEVEDVEGADRWLREREDIDGGDISLAGWSFGSWVGLRWAIDKGECHRLALISPPLIGFDFFDFLAEKALPLSTEVVIVSGEMDQFSTAERRQELARKLKAELHTITGADHFLYGREKEVAESIVRRWKLPGGPGSGANHPSAQTR